MAIAMQEEQLIQHISDTLEKLENMLHNLRMSKASGDRQKSIKVAYWLQSYADYVEKERDFNSNNLPSYPFRSIINVDFGFRLGCELGGWHYAVVLDKENNRSSDTITVIPLTSKKPNSKNSKYSVILSEGIFEVYATRFDSYVAAAKKLIDETKAIQASLSDINDPAERRIALNESRMKTDAAKKWMDDCDEIYKRLEKLKEGTVANISQITTISKRRIIRPKSHKDTMYNLKISTEEMKLIQDAIKNLYIVK